MHWSRLPSASAAILLLAACAPAAPCSPGAAYVRGEQGLGPDARCTQTPETRAANDEGFADRLRLNRLTVLAEDRLSGRHRLDPGAISIAPLEAPPAPPEPVE